MNIFYLHEEPAVAAAWHCDKHCVKMILETAQILSTAHHVLDGEDIQIEGLYKSTHVNHPSTVWARSGLENYKWLHRLLDELCYQYTKRYKKVHKVELSGLLANLSTPPQNISNERFSEPPQCMPDEYKVVSPTQSKIVSQSQTKVVSPTQKAYINYYIGEKMGFARWNYTTPPPWA
jgi:hypothetical protein